ncbi:Nucleolar complex-associated protein 3 [Pichia kudriavzevii]|uniref:Nucleolar complex-associated protein 3 n=1 Tax=Pichia kudriavzevii TaxID=4909 RepID=A0A1V2LMN2_PICKU|nr:Nucleolar complex-associated protein 3 [Pichia kudriavzevii]
MGKRRVKRASELRNVKRRKEEDSKLQSSVFSRVEDDISDIEVDDQNEEYMEVPEEIEDEEAEDYERIPRAFNDPDADGEEGLPIRRSDGTLQRRIIMKTSKPTNDEAANDEEDGVSGEEEAEDPETREEKQRPGAGEEFDEEADESYKGLTPEEKVIKTKEDIAEMAQNLIENPEENILQLSRLRRMSNSKNPLTAKLAILAMVPVFKSIAPSYHIRALSESEKKEKVSREVAKLRLFEQHLVLNYKHYVELLAEKAAKFSTQPKVTSLDAEMGIIASNAACELASALRYFNFRKEVLKIITRRVMKKPQNEHELKVFKKCVSTLEELLVEDASNGDISLELVVLLSKSIRRRAFNVDESIINILLSLTVLNDYSPNSRENDDSPKLKKKDRIHLSKKERKQLKERKLIDKEMREAEQAVTAEQREKNQAQILKMLLLFYLEILKARPVKLMAAVLESLSRFGHMVNIDLMGDFLQVMREIAEEILINKDLNSNEVRQVLLCIITSFSLVANLPSRKVVVDLNKFVDYLYSLLPNLSLDTEIEFSHKTLRLMDPLSSELNIKPSVNVSTKAELLLRCLNAIFFNSKSGSSKRALAFTKRLYLAALHLPEKSSVASMKFIDKLIGRYDDIKTLYSTEDRVQNGIYNAEIDETERANTEVAVLWENVLLDKHYATNVAMGARHLFKNAK